MDVLRDHRRSDLRHDRDDRRVRYSVNRRGHRVMVDHPVNRRSDLRDDDHRLLSDDRHRMDFRDVDDLKLGVSRVIRSCAPHDLKMDGSLVVNHDLRRSDRLDDRNLDVMMDASHANRMSGLLDDRNLGVMTGVNHDRYMNVTDGRNDLTMVASLDVSRGHRMSETDDRSDRKMDVSRGHRMSGLLDDHLKDDDRHDALVDHRMNAKDDLNDLNLDVNRVNRNCALRDRKMGGNLDVSRGHHMDDQLVYRKTDVSRANRNCDPHDLKLDVNLDAMSHHVMYY